jgi:hypothetical protein
MPSLAAIIHPRSPQYAIGNVSQRCTRANKLFECGLTVILAVSFRLVVLAYGRRCLTPPRRPALAILRKPASGTSTFPIRNALTISAKRLQSGRKHSFVIVDALRPCPTSPQRHCVLRQPPSLCDPWTRLNLYLFSSLRPSSGSPNAPCWRLVACLVALLPVQQSLRLLLTMSDIALIVYLSDRWVTAGPTSYEQLALRTCLSLKQQSCRLRILE